jgi:hypothetical protein
MTNVSRNMAIVGRFKRYGAASGSPKGWHNPTCVSVTTPRVLASSINTMDCTGSSPGVGIR